MTLFQGPFFKVPLLFLFAFVRLWVFHKFLFSCGKPRAFFQNRQAEKPFLRLPVFCLVFRPAGRP